MGELVADCPRCTTKKISLNVRGQSTVIYDGYVRQWEVFCVCGHCNRATIFVLKQKHSTDSSVVEGADSFLKMGGTINKFVCILKYVSLTDVESVTPPDHLPQNIESAFKEGATCLATRCFNAAGTMFRLCIDFASKDKMPEGNENGLNYKTRRELGLRLPWLFDNGLLPEDLRELSASVKEDGNDGAHQGTLTEVDALDLLDFTMALLERIYTEPERLRLAKERRDNRRGVVVGTPP